MRIDNKSIIIAAVLSLGVILATVVQVECVGGGGYGVVWVGI